jgi:RNA polymerase sigma factor for flagellar operon FliA
MMTQSRIAEENYEAVSQLDEEERDRLVMENLPEVNYIARRIHGRIPKQVPLEDLMNAGVVGLLEAIDRYDSNRNIKLISFAKMRIQGAILDSLRDLDWSPRDLRKKARELEDVMQRIRSRTADTPSTEEIAREMGLSLDSVDNLLAELRGVDLGSLEALAAQSERNDQLYNYLPTSSEDDPACICLKSELQEYLAQAISELPKRERELIALYYVEELTMKEVGAVLGVGEGRISQIHSAALLQLRHRLHELLTARQPQPSPSSKREACDGRSY